MEKMGFHGKQVSVAGNAIGLNNPGTIGTRYRGEADTTITERLAMSAVAAGLAPWSPELHEHLLNINSIASSVLASAENRDLKIKDADQEYNRSIRELKRAAG